MTFQPTAIAGALPAIGALAMILRGMQSRKARRAANPAKCPTPGGNLAAMVQVPKEAAPAPAARPKPTARKPVERPCPQCGNPMDPLETLCLPCTRAAGVEGGKGGQTLLHWLIFLGGLGIIGAGGYLFG